MEDIKKITLITGGARSGKSALAVEMARKYGHRVFIATAEPFDVEMEDRISRHRAERGDLFTTIEEPLDPAAALARLPEGTQIVVIDCMTVWLGNLMHHMGDDTEIYPRIKRFLAALKSPLCGIIIVTNEVGLGLIPADPFSRRYRDLAGRLNQEIAKIADEVFLVACGIPVRIKGEA